MGVSHCVIVTLPVALLALPPQASADTDGGWEFGVTPYGWLMQVDGRVAALPGQPPVKISISFTDVVEDLDYGGMFLVSARKQRVIIRGDGLFAKVSSGENLDNPVFTGIDLENTFGFAGGTLGYVFHEGERYRIEANAGLRHWWFGTDVRVRTTLPGGINLSGNAEWTDPLIGITGTFLMTRNWTVYGQGTVGGFGAGSEFEAGLLVAAQYDLNGWLSLGFGWRHLYVNYTDELVYRVHHSGPVLGVSLRF